MYTFAYLKPTVVQPRFRWVKGLLKNIPTTLRLMPSVEGQAQHLKLSGLGL